MDLSQFIQLGSDLTPLNGESGVGLSIGSESTGVSGLGDFNSLFALLANDLTKDLTEDLTAPTNPFVSALGKAETDTSPSIEAGKIDADGRLLPHEGQSLPPKNPLTVASQAAGLNQLFELESASEPVIKPSQGELAQSVFLLNKPTTSASQLAAADPNELDNASEELVVAPKPVSANISKDPVFPSAISIASQLKAAEQTKPAKPVEASKDMLHSAVDIDKSQHIKATGSQTLNPQLTAHVLTTSLGAEVSPQLNTSLLLDGQFMAPMNTQASVLQSTIGVAGTQQALNLQQPNAETPLGQTMIWMMNKGMQNARVLVSPAELGNIDIKLDIQNDQEVRLQLVTQTVMARDSLELAMPRLRDMLGEQNLNLVQVDISQRDAHQHLQQEGADFENQTFANQANELSDEGHQDLVDDEQVLMSGLLTAQGLSSTNSFDAYA